MTSQNGVLEAKRSTRWRLWARLSVAGLTFFGSLALFAFSSRQTSMTTVHIQIDLYSGRENPEWTLGEMDAAEFLRRVATLAPTSTSTSFPSQELGYRGLRVSVIANGRKRRYVIGEGLVSMEASVGFAPRRFRDANRSLEIWMLNGGREVLGADLLRYLVGGGR